MDTTGFGHGFHRRMARTTRIRGTASHGWFRRDPAANVVTPQTIRQEGQGNG
jgi:hypothetical protein